jgi:hypothetical protein
MGMARSDVPMGMAPTGVPMGPVMTPPRSRSSSRSSGVPMGMAATGIYGYGSDWYAYGYGTNWYDASAIQSMIAPGVVMKPSRSSSRSHRSEHRRTPPASQPVIINMES